jgi:1,4-dihydroxy-2-naphthoyl-CoA hydrolase
MSRHLLRPEVSVASLNARAPEHLPGWFGIEITRVEPGGLSPVYRSGPRCWRRTASCTPRRSSPSPIRAPATRPSPTCRTGAEGFTTIELKTNFLGTLTEGRVAVRGERLCTAGARRRSGTPK